MIRDLRFGVFPTDELRINEQILHVEHDGFCIVLNKYFDMSVHPGTTARQWLRCWTTVTRLFCDGEQAGR